MSEREDPAERLARKTTKTDGCWFWTGSVNNMGYGRLPVRGDDGRHAKLYAHRVAYELAHGTIPDGLVVRHTCDTPRCVRPEHLILGTQRDNVIDMGDRDRHPLYHPKVVRQEILDRILAGESILAVSRDLRVSYKMAAAVIQRHRSRRAA